MNLKELAEIMRQLRCAKKAMREYEYYRRQNEEALKSQKTGLPQTDNFHIRYMGVSGSLLNFGQYGAHGAGPGNMDAGEKDLMCGIWRGYLLKSRSD